MRHNLLAATLLLSAVAGLSSCDNATIKGRVTIDGKPAAGVLVSDGNTIVKTGNNGRYSIVSDKKDSVVFITTPSGAVAVAEDGNRPGFWALLTEAPDKVETHDFQLVSENQDNYNVIFMPDIHLSNDPRRDDLNRFKKTVVPFIKDKVAGSEGPVYLINLGDFTHELYWYEMDFNEADGYEFLNSQELPVKIYAVTGNHDHDGAVVGENVDQRAGWLYRRVWGPDRYSVNIGNDHWVFLDDIVYINVEGQGKKAPGIKGDRSYEHKFTDAQLAWLEKDLSYVPDEANVYICTHCPFFSGSYKGKGKTLIPEEQLAVIDSLCTRFAGKALNFAGHIHKFDFYEMPQYPSLFQYGLTCSSGIMWETPAEHKLYATDGSEAGMMFGKASGKNPLELRFETYEDGEKYYMIYDMNSVAEAYRKSPEVRIQRKVAPERADYSARKFRNCVFVNYWAWKPGDTVEMYENGKPLEVKNVHHEDPIKNFTYDLPKLKNPAKHHKARQTDKCIHMFEAKASSAKTPVEIVIKDRDGNELFRETVQRPLPFVY